MKIMIKRFARVGFAAVLMLTLAGCKTDNDYAHLGKRKTPDAAPIVLHEGDAVKITFPGAPNLNATKVIKRDGLITLEFAGDVHAAGMTAKQLEEELLKLYGPQLQTKEVTVSVEASEFPVYVTGCVQRPGKVLLDRPLTPLQVIMEAGGFDFAKANQKAVRVIRNENGQTKHFTLNLKKALQGEETEPFDLKPGDILYVPERFSWY